MRALGRTLYRFGLMLGGEAVQSAFHFGLNIVLVRAMSPHDYGRFAILFLVGGLSITYVRALAGVPAAIHIPGSAGRRAEHGHEVAFGSAALLLSVAIACAVAAALAIGSDIGALGGGLFVGLWTLRSYVRLALFSKRRPGTSGLGDLVFALSGAGLAWVLMRGGGADQLDAVLAALACANALGIAASLAALRRPVRISFGRGMRRRYRGLTQSLTWSLVGTTTANIQGQGQSLLVAFFAGPAAYAPIAATFVLFSPLRLAASALINMAQPDMAAALAAGRPDRARVAALRCAGLLAAAGLFYGGGVLALLPFIEGRLFDRQFNQAPMALIAVCTWAIVAISLLHAPLRVLLETMQAFRTLATLAAASALAGGIVVVALLLVAVPAWSLLGVLLSELIVLGGCGLILRPPRVPARRRSEPGSATRRDLPSYPRSPSLP